MKADLNPAVKMCSRCGDAHYPKPPSTICATCTKYLAYIQSKK